MEFRPSLFSTLTMLVLVLAFTRLGGCQLERGAKKDTRLKAFASADSIIGLPEVSDALEFTRLTIKGHFKPGRNTLADNQVFRGRPGVHVYTAFELESGGEILVNRGWLAMGRTREILPVVDTPSEQLEIKGRLGPMPLPGRQLGVKGAMSPDRWPQLVTYPDLDKISLVLNAKLYPMVLFLDEASPAGFADRQWKPVFMSPERHRAYAFQWFALALTAFSGWVFITLRKGKTK